MSKPVSKAALKREKDLKSSIEFKLRKTLLPFEDKYLGMYCKYQINQLKFELADLKAKNGTTVTQKGYNGKPYRHTYVLDQAIKNLEFLLSRVNSLTLRFMTEAKEGYDQKLTRLVDKVVEAGIKRQFLKVVDVKNDGSQFSFFIQDNEKRVFARTIIASGPCVVPHYRFITTIKSL